MTAERTRPKPTIADHYVLAEDMHVIQEHQDCAICGTKFEVGQRAIDIDAGFGPQNAIVTAHLACAVDDDSVALDVEKPPNELVMSVWEHRCSDGVGGCTAISATVVDWPIVIEDAPLKCARCDKPIVGSGTGPIRSLARLISEHARSCDGE